MKLVKVKERKRQPTLHVEDAIAVLLCASLEQSFYDIIWCELTADVKKTVNVFYCLSINVHVLYFCYIKSFFSIVLRPLYFICIALASRYYFIFVRGTDSIPPFVLFLLFLLLLQRLGLCRFIGSELNLARSFFIDWRVRFLTSYFQDMHTHNAYIRAYIETPAENINCQRP